MAEEELKFKQQQEADKQARHEKAQAEEDARQAALK